MHNKATKITPLLLILLVSFSALANSSISLTNTSGPNTTGITVSHGPSSTAWISNGSSYAIYNGHLFNEHYISYPYGSNRTDIIMTAHVSVDNHTLGYSNISIQAYEFFTNAIVPDVSGFWHQIDVASGEVSDTNTHQLGLNGNQSFFFVPLAGTYSVSDTVLISSPFSSASLNFTVMSTTETVLNISTIKIAYYSHPTPDQETNVTLWISQDSGLLMRIIGRQWQQFIYSYYERYSMDMSMEIGETNIESLVMPTPPVSAVPWMDAGKYIQYNVEGSGWIDAQIMSSGVSLIPGLPRFRATVSANVTMRIERGTTAYVDPWYSTRYIWVVHLMLNNTKLLLPDFRHTIDIINSTFPGSISQANVSTALAELSPFNHTGLIAHAWLLVDKETGIMLMPGMHLGLLQQYNANASETLGDWLAHGYGLQVLSWFAQSMLYKGWSISPPGFPIDKHTTYGPYYDIKTQTEDVHVDASIACVGTEYLSFPGGGGGLTWRLQSILNVHEAIYTLLNMTNVHGFSPSYLMGNITLDETGTGFINVERTSGFPLAFDQQITFNFDSATHFTNATHGWSYTVHFGLGLELKAYVPRTNIWFSNPPIYLTVGVGGGNMTSPESHFGTYGFDVWMNGANNVVVNTSASQPTDTATPPGGQLPFQFFSIHGNLTGSGNAVLYVYYNRTIVVNVLHLDENTLKIYSFNNVTHLWEALQSTHLVINNTHGVIFAVLPHFSYFAVFGAQAQGAGQQGISSLYIIIAAVAVIGILAAVVYVRRKKGVSKAALKIQ